MELLVPNLVLTVGANLALWPVWILLFFLIPAVVVAALVYRPVRARWSDEPICGFCGYKVKGVNSLKCPECDSDLREVGIRRPRGGIIWALLIAGSLGVVVGSAYLGAAIVMARLEGETKLVAPRPPADRMRDRGPDPGLE